MPSPMKSFRSRCRAMNEISGIARGRGAFDQQPDLRALAGDEVRVGHPGREPQDQLVEEQEQAVVAELLGVREIAASPSSSGT
jgi:hypothetical protein